MSTKIYRFSGQIEVSAHADPDTVRDAINAMAAQRGWPVLIETTEEQPDGWQGPKLPEDPPLSDVPCPGGCDPFTVRLYGSRDYRCAICGHPGLPF